MTRDAFGRQIPDEPVGLGAARVLRQSCDECGSRAIEIGGWDQMASRFSPDQIDSIREGAAFVGVDLATSSPVVWRCLSCGNLGIFGDWQSDF